MATTTKTMTERELLTAIIDGKEITAEMQEKAVLMLTALDKRNSKRKESGTKTQKENSELKDSIMTAIQAGEIETVDGYITSKTTAKYLKELTENPELSTNKATALLGQLAKSGLLEISEVKTKSGKVKGYKISE